jgi:hypothetical protein
MRAMDERTLDRPWSVPVTLREISEAGRRFELTADAATRAVIARAAGLSALPRLEAVFDVSRRGAHGLHVTGRVSATVGQICVVSLDPIESEVEELVDLSFVAGAPPAVEHAPGKGRQVEIITTETPEPLLDDTVDLGAVATEFLILGIDPYPRKPGAVFQTPQAGDEPEHPFAALAKLGSGQGGNAK